MSEERSEGDDPLRFLSTYPRHKSGLPVTMSTFALEKQMAAACMVHPYEASQILGIRDEARPNGIPSRESLRDLFTFTAQDLHAYILDAPMRAGEIYNRALDNRALPAPYIWDVDDGFHVGHYDGPPDGFHDVSLHHHIDDAATDFVLAYWGLPRWQGAPVSDSKAAAVFDNLHPTQRQTRLRRMAASIRAFIEKWTGC